MWNSINGRTDTYNPTTVWSYGNVEAPLPTDGVAPAPNISFNYPAYAIEATSNDLDTIRWINDLVDGSGKYLPHLFAVDQTPHWANPMMDSSHGPPNRTDCSGSSAEPYQDPVLSPLLSNK